MTPKPIQHIHLLGIGGVAMAPLAGMLKERGYRVTGSDANIYPPASTFLESRGIPWNEGFAEENLDPPPDLAVIGNVIARGNPELEFILDRKIAFASMAAVLETFFIVGHTSLVVAGTHGKTTTTSLLAWIFHSAGRRPDFLVGGAALNFGDGSYGLGGGEEFIIEGDEYETAFFDRGPKFMHYHPDQLILTSCEFDHADIYDNLEAVQLAFRRLVNLVPRRGKILAYGESPAVRLCVASAFCQVETYGLGTQFDWSAEEIEWNGEQTIFRVMFRGRSVGRFRTPHAGSHAVLNSLAAIGMALGRGVEFRAIEQAVAAFQGVRRRMELKGEAGGVAVVEDFAHHPTAIRATLEAARVCWPGRRLWAVFEPRSNTMRRRIFSAELIEALSLADAALLGPVNRSQFLTDEERLDPVQVAASIRKRGTEALAFASANEIVAHLVRTAKPSDVIVVMSNGSFDGLCGKLLQQIGGAREEFVTEEK